MNTLLPTPGLLIDIRITDLEGEYLDGHNGIEVKSRSSWSRNTAHRNKAG